MRPNLRLLTRILAGGADANIRFDDLRGLLKRLGFVERIRGSHHRFRYPGTAHMANLQRDGSDAKVYQVRQVRRMLIQAGFAAITQGDH